MVQYWVAVASANHVQRGRAGGFMQVSHGKRSPLLRLRPGDVVAYYSPSSMLGEKDGLQAFTAMGRVLDGEPYQGDMGGGFEPFRRDVDWFDTKPAAIRPLLEILSFTAGKTNWGYQLRFGLFAATAEDFGKIAAALSCADQLSAS